MDSLCTVYSICYMVVNVSAHFCIQIEYNKEMNKVWSFFEQNFVFLSLSIYELLRQTLLLLAHILYSMQDSPSPSPSCFRQLIYSHRQIIWDSQLRLALYLSNERHALCVVYVKFIGTIESTDDLQRARLFCGRMIWLLAHCLSPYSIQQLNRRHTGRLRNQTKSQSTEPYVAQPAKPKLYETVAVSVACTHIFLLKNFLD